MIQVNKNTCCGCGACAQICAHNCIQMIPDPKDGFLYPSIDKSKCTQCRMCVKVCPVINHNLSEKIPDVVFAVQNPNKRIVKESSSGGLFSLLAERVINQGGIVYGASFNDTWDVVIKPVDSVQSLTDLRGAKYVQAKTGDSFRKARQYLQNERLVLFSGTPCQIAGLKYYLGRDYNNLLTVDVVCHGVPSPLAWTKYLEEKQTPVETVSFRDKTFGWKNYCVRFDHNLTPHEQDLYMMAFLQNLDIRRSCSCCRFKCGSSCSDLTIGDLWGIESINPVINDDSGLCSVIVNTKKGFDSLQGVPILQEIPFVEIIKYNPSVVKSSNHNINRDFFMHQLTKLSFTKAYENAISNGLNNRIIRYVFRLYHSL